MEAQTVSVVGVASAGGTKVCPKHCPRHAALGSLLGVAGWLGAALAAVAVATVPFDFGESLCGAWGCLPPLPALAAMHLLWLVAGGATVWALRRWVPALLRPAGVVLALAAVVGLAVVIGQDVPQWAHRVGVEDQHHWPKRVAYRLATLTDVPFVQAVLTGVACGLFGGRRRPAVCAISSPVSGAQ